jgi:hypothetical protein
MVQHRTEAEWSAYTDPEDLIVYLQKQGHDPCGRKLRLLAVACCRRLWHLLPEPQRQVVEAAEQVAEGVELSAEEWDRLVDNFEDGEGFTEITRGSIRAISAIHASFIDLRISRVFNGCAAALTWSELPAERPGFGPHCLTIGQLWRHHPDLARRYDVVFPGKLKEQCRLVFEIFGHLFLGVTFEAAWRTPSVTAVARAIYDERRFGDLPILADALEEAGCTSAELLDHCRSGGDHVRGCWAVDLVLDRS